MLYSSGRNATVTAHKIKTKINEPICQKYINGLKTRQWFLVKKNNGNKQSEKEELKQFIEEVTKN